MMLPSIPIIPGPSVGTTNARPLPQPINAIPMAIPPTPMPFYLHNSRPARQNSLNGTQKHPELYDFQPRLIFKVGRTLYTADRKSVVGYSQELDNIVARSTSMVPPKGFMDKSPIDLSKPTPQQFEAFLRFTSNSLTDYQRRPLTPIECCHAIHFSSEHPEEGYDAPIVREKALSSLETAWELWAPVDRYILAREQDCLPAMKLALISMCERESYLSNDEIEKLEKHECVFIAGVQVAILSQRYNKFNGFNRFDTKRIIDQHLAKVLDDEDLSSTRSYSPFPAGPTIIPPPHPPAFPTYVSPPYTYNGPSFPPYPNAWSSGPNTYYPPPAPLACTIPSPRANSLSTISERTTPRMAAWTPPQAPTVFGPTYSRTSSPSPSPQPYIIRVPTSPTATVMSCTTDTETIPPIVINQPSPLSSTTVPIPSPTTSYSCASCGHHNQQQREQKIVFGSETIPNPEYDCFALESPYRVVYMNKTFPTAAHALNAMPFFEKHPELADVISRTPSEKLEKVVKGFLEGFGSDLDDSRLLADQLDQVIKLRFSQHSSLRQKLLQTGNQMLVDETARQMWGFRELLDLNELGQSLMRVRSEL